MFCGENVGQLFWRKLVSALDSGAPGLIRTGDLLLRRQRRQPDLVGFSSAACGWIGEQTEHTALIVGVFVGVDFSVFPTLGFTRLEILDLPAESIGGQRGRNENESSGSAPQGKRGHANDQIK